jgi:hypothetical protein
MNVNLTMITDAATINGIHVRALPQLKQFRIFVYAGKQLLELLVLSCRNI